MIDAIRAHAGQRGAADGEPTPVPRTASRPKRTVDCPVADDSLLIAAAKRDLAAFAPLYDRYLGPIYRYCLVRLANVESAEDATAQIFTKALDALNTCHDAHFRSWLFTIARNVVIDAHRAARALDPLDAALGVPDPGPSPDDLAIGADSTLNVHALLAHLPPDQRDIVELRLAGLTGPEIARTLNRSHVAIRVGQFRAYARLRGLLRPPDTVASNQETHSMEGTSGSTAEDGR